jgi:biopolymer transport protein ExbB
VLEIVKAGGWLMLPIMLCSVAALAITLERFFALNPKKVVPPNLVAQVWSWIKNNQIDSNKLRDLRQTSPLGLLLATGIVNARHGRDVMRESIESASSVVLLELERYQNALGTVAMIAPMLGLVGSVFGIIQVFNDIRIHGSGDAAALAGGIAEALITTASGLVVAIPATMMHRYFNGRIATLVVQLEQESVKLMDALLGDRDVDAKEDRLP